MKKLFLGIVTAGLVVAPVGTSFADTGVVYSSCLSTSLGKGLSNMQVRIDAYNRAYTDANGCFSASVEANTPHRITMTGYSSMLDYVPDSNGFYYTFQFDTGELTQDTTTNNVIPVTELTVEATGVDGRQIIDPKLELNGFTNTTLANGQPMYMAVRGDLRAMTGSGNIVVTGVPDEINGDFRVDADPSYGYEQYQQNFTALGGGQVRVATTLQYPAPESVDNVGSTVDAGGHAHLYWTSASDAVTTNIYGYDAQYNRVLLASLPASATTYDLGQLPHQGSYSYVIKAANQYGYEGNRARGAGVIWDLDAPVLHHYNLAAASAPAGTGTTFDVYYTDVATNVETVEYFVDTDPGVGNGIQLGQVDDNYYLIDQVGQDLPVGTYSIGVRAKDQAGNWSGVTYKTLTIDEAPAVQSEE